MLNFNECPECYHPVGEGRETEQAKLQSIDSDGGTITFHLECPKCHAETEWSAHFSQHNNSLHHQPKN